MGGLHFIDFGSWSLCIESYVALIGGILTGLLYPKYSKEYSKATIVKIKYLKKLIRNL